MWGDLLFFQHMFVLKVRPGMKIRQDRWMGTTFQGNGVPHLHLSSFRDIGLRYIACGKRPNIRPCVK